jgi:hypothetical protein
MDGHLFVARGAKGDQQIDHHPLVKSFLTTVPTGRLVRGAERHAELIALSDALHEDGKHGTNQNHRHDMHASFESFLIRETGDPLAGTPARPCETCLAALVDFGLLPWSELGHIADSRSTSEQIPQPGRFPEEVAAVLAGGGWLPLAGVSRDALADTAIKDTVRIPGQTRRHRPFPAVRAALGDFPVLQVMRRGPGVRRLIRPLTIDPMAAAHSADVLGEFAEVIGAPVFPLGVEARGDAWLVVDERGRVFALDQGGEWFVGDSVDHALIGLLTGDGPAERIRDDGSW